MGVSPSEFAAIIAAGGAAGAGFIKALDLLWGKASRDATARKTTAEARVSEQEVAASEVRMLRDIITEVRTSEKAKVVRISNLERRMNLLEERERHMLTRAAVHEAWDQMAFALLLATNPEHPPPPPLIGIEDRDDSDRNDDDRNDQKERP